MASALPVFLVIDDSPTQLFGLTGKQRLERQFTRAKLAQVTDVADASRHPMAIVARADVAIDQPLIQLLATAEPLVLLSDTCQLPLAVCCDGHRAADALRVLRGEVAVETLNVPAYAPSQLKVNFWKALRKRETPYARLVNAETAPDVEWRMFMGTYKGATDLVTKHVWPRPAFYATRWLAPRGITPNMVTTVGAIMTALAFWLFLRGDFAWGLVAAWCMTFLDTVDGKLARTTLTSSKWGDVFDHGIDLIHPPFWYIAWAVGLGHAGYQWSNAQFWWVVGAILGGYVLQRVMEGISIKWLGLEIHIWRRIDTYFREITARRNPNLVILTISTLFGRPDIGLFAVAWWTVICLVLHGLQLLQAFSAKRQTGELTSWMTQP